MNPSRPRLFYLDLIRAAALFCILIVHFNATVTGYFTYPSRLFGSVLPGSIYLGDFGSTLFFIVSGAALAYTAKTPFSISEFYKKRAKAVYPMFWLAWCLCFSIRFVRLPGYYGGAKTLTLPLSVLGLDHFAVAAGWVSTDFACVGEWFLGSILFLYLLFPALKYGLEQAPRRTWALALLVCLPVHLLGWDHQLVAIHALEFLFGISFARRRWERLPAGPRRAAAWAAALLAWPAASALARLASPDAKCLCAAVGCAVFALLAWAAPLAERGVVPAACRVLGKYSYAAFLVHHVLILRMAEGIDLAALSRRDTALLFLCYLLWTALASVLLYRFDGWLRRHAAAFLAASCRPTPQ